MQKILIAGGTGLIGSNLVTKLKQKNFNIVLLTTQKNKANNKDTFFWEPASNIIPKDVLSDIDICINLCGASIFQKRFTAQRKTELLESRILPLELLYQTFKNNNIQLKHFISASATGYYPNICSDILTENSTKGTGFISDLVAEWEQSAERFEDISSNVSIIRTGIVFSDKGGFLKQLSLPIKYFAGAIPGNGKQLISWIHVDDWSEMVLHLIEHGLSGIYNAVGNQPETINKITHQIASTINRPLFLPNIPGFILKLIFGERYKLLLTSQNVNNEKIRQTGFNFRFENAQSAIENLLKK